MNSTLFKIIKIPLLILILTTCTQLRRWGSPENCLVTRSAIDLGSGSMKFSLAKVDVCEKKIRQILWEEQYPLKFKESLLHNQGILSHELYESSLAYLKQLKQKIPLDYYHKPQVRIVATEVFREASNGQDFLEKLSQETNLPIQIIPQIKEAELGFWGVMAHSEKKPEEIVVWDIGGGSMQMSTYRADKFYHYLGKLASVSFKNKVLEILGKKSRSPNPIGALGLNEGLNFAEATATREVPVLVKEDLKNKEVIGIGGVHYYSIQQQINLKSHGPYSLFELLETAKTRSHWPDGRFQSPYTETEVTNLVLVAGFMKGLHIHTVLPQKINLTDGILVDEDLWRFKL